jgi:hypothetical protein
LQITRQPDALAALLRSLGVSPEAHTMRRFLCCVLCGLR